MANSNGFPLDLPNFADPLSFETWQRRMVDLLDFTVDRGINTDDTSTKTIISLTLEQLKSYLIESWVLGVLNSALGDDIPGVAQLNVFRGGFHLDASNVAQVVGAGVSKIYSGISQGLGAERWTASLVVNGVDGVKQQVTGIAGDVVIWRCRIKLFTAEV